MSTKIKLVRVDNRLLHSTVALNWHHFINSNYVVIIDPSHIEDPFIEKVMQLCLPKTMTVKIFSVERLIDFLKEETAAKRNLILLFKNLDAVRDAVACGFYYPEIQIPYPASRIVIKKLSDFFDKEQIESLQYIKEKGIKFYFQTSPLDPRNYSFFNYK